MSNNDTIFTDDNLQTAVNDWINDSSAAEIKYGHISNWDVSQVTNMLNLFKNAQTFNQDIGGWDVSSVENMTSMFKNAINFNKDISKWNVSKVVSMNQMFQAAQTFNQDISTKTVTLDDESTYIAWDVSSVKNMKQMFKNARYFNQDISEWDVSGVTNTNGINAMFNKAQYFNQDISGWDISNITDFTNAFNSATAFINGYGSGWIEDNTIPKTSLFWKVNRCNNSQACNYMSSTDGSCERPLENYNCTGSWVGDYCGAASACNTGSRATCDYPESDRVDCEVNNLYCEDSQACNYNQLLDGGSCEYPPENYNCTGSWMGEICDDSQALNYNGMGSCRSPWEFTNESLEPAVDEWITDSESAEAKYGHISDWDVSQVTYMSSLFKDASSFNDDIGNWDVSNVVLMGALFHNATSFNQDISGWHVSNVKSMLGLFSGAESFNQDISGWDISNAKLHGMFENAFSFIEGYGSGWIVDDTDIAEYTIPKDSLFWKINRICDDSQAMNYGSAGSCFYENNNNQLNNSNNVASEYGTGTTNGTQSYDTGDETGNNPNIATTSSDIGSVFNNMNVLNNNNNNNNVTIDENGNTVTMTQEQLQALIDKVSDLNTSFQNYTSGEFQVNDRYYTTTGELLSYNSPDAPQIQLIPGKDIIDQYEVKYEESQQPNMTYDNETHIPFNYYYKQNTDPNVAYPYDTNEVPIKKPETKYPFFENRFDRPTNFDGKSHTYMHPQNWRYPEHKAPKCKKQKEPNEPVDLDKNYISLNNWDSQIGTILPGFTYKENKY